MNKIPFTPKVSPARWRSPFALGALALVLLATGVGIGRLIAPAKPPAVPPAADPDAAQVLYWYDPMRPEQHFDRPGKSPFMDMQLVPKYAESAPDSEAAGTLSIDPRLAQNLGMRVVSVVGYQDVGAGAATTVVASGVLGFNEREVAILQTRSAGFVAWVKPLAEGDLVARGETIARLLLPEWVALQQELLALQTLGDPSLIAAGRERMAAAGMSAALIEQVLASARVDNRVALSAPIDGVVTEVGLRAGMSVAAGATVVAIRDIDPVWLEVAVPEAEAHGIAVGDEASVQFAAFPGQNQSGTVERLLPILDRAARSLRVRVVLANPQHRLRPGMSAQVTLKAEGPPAAGSTPADAVLVPAAAVIDSGQRSLVMLAESNGRYRPQIVNPGPEIGDLRVIWSGLKVGDKVVASGQFLLDSEASLQGLLLRADPPEAEAEPAPSPAHEHAEGRRP